MSVEGTLAYMASARDAANQANIATLDTDEIRVRIPFPEIKSSDGMYAALMVNGFDNPAEFPAFVAEVGPISSVTMTRVEFMRKRATTLYH
jgi:hypothetical protein